MQLSGHFDTLSDIESAFNTGEFDRSLLLAQLMRIQVLHGSIDPIAFGWSRWYEFKSLHQLQRYEEALAQLDRDEPAPYAMTESCAAWMFFAAAELCALLNRPLDLVRHAGRGLEFRRDSLEDSLRLANAACRWLARLNRDDLNATFAWLQIRRGHAERAHSAVLEGIGALCDHIAQTDSASQASAFIRWLVWQPVFLPDGLHHRVVRTVYAVSPCLAAPIRWLWTGYLALRGL
jgi:hypothetical protein